ncbi:alginate lyase family protein [Flavilitoribacter nigricans]|uniref:Uncharacterized protein n=1 Tax=Flavilitoribacter nigricans (strain ATCC 23147 / DSM 23189 / NBRC 102662 / NCIMB 1420 / SS-2) TaxID=1122177 RepID=A0A2D0NJF6_FLAN2|nr:alginate lyase family protein [Flavilitoribacter nigricans]PHN08587.1 hypothetical protein CRP01_01360 [Flavilitoribacter nigricans DSM 23189 = NBRC 102662]
MVATLRRYYNTLRYLKWKQIRYQVYYKLLDHLPLQPDYSEVTVPIERSATVELHLQDSIPAAVSYLGLGHFRFLNVDHRFEEEIDWNLDVYGKLWTYNLNYFEFLGQADMTDAVGFRLIRDFIRKEELIKDGLEPFPISLRVVNWIKFLSKYRLRDAETDRSLYRQIQYLRKRLEFHLLGNHLLENAFALLFGGAYFGDPDLIREGRKLLTAELDEQILPDGAHFELSPMYHQLMLFRVLDSINLVEAHPALFQSDLLPFLKEKAQKMLGWLAQMTFTDGTVPGFNDTAPGIAPDTDALSWYGQQLQCPAGQSALAESGYRKFSRDSYECIVDAGRIGPDYLPGHAHCDTLSFVLHHRGKPLIVDTGISTYEKNKRRTAERSTAAHNTVIVGETEQSEVWGGFRVARRAGISSLKVSTDQLTAEHDGFRRIGETHRRSFHFSDQVITIEDATLGKKRARAFLHFHPDVSVQLRGNELTWAFGKLHFDKAEKVVSTVYEYAAGFNQRVKATRIIIHFSDRLTTKILLH